MSTPPTPDVNFEIDDMDTLRVLVDETRLAIVEHLASPTSVAELSTAMEVPRTRLYHHIGLLEEHGLIRVVDERRSGAQTEKLYQVTAKNYRPSERFLESAEPREQAAAIIDSLFAATRSDFVRAADTGVLRFDQRSEHRSLALARRVVSLTPARATELVTAVEALLTDFEDDPTDDAVAYGILTIIYPSSRSTS